MIPTAEQSATLAICSALVACAAALVSITSVLRLTRPHRAIKTVTNVGNVMPDNHPLIVGNLQRMNTELRETLMTTTREARYAEALADVRLDALTMAGIVHNPDWEGHLVSLNLKRVASRAVPPEVMTGPSTFETPNGPL